MKNHIIETRERVKKILEKYALARDCDMTLLSIIWHNDLKRQDIDSLSLPVSELFFMMRMFKLTHFESVRRCRASIQKEFPHLKGINKRKRKLHDSEVRNAVRQKQI